MQNTATRLQAIRLETASDHRIAQLAFQASAYAELAKVPSYLERYKEERADFLHELEQEGILQSGDTGEINRVLWGEEVSA